jgi:hypothetical protein
VVDVHIAGLDEPIVTTANHPFWSEDQQTFVPASALGVGEQVRTLAGLAHVTSVTARGPPEAVYNLEVHGEHVYQVTSLGVLVHNACPGLHHFIPRSLGSLVPYGDDALTHFNRYRHTKLHKRLGEFLKDKTKVLPDGRTVNMNPVKGNPGSAVRRNFTLSERVNALDEFYQQYNKGEYYAKFKAELTDAMARGLLH